MTSENSVGICSVPIVVLFYHKSPVSQKNKLVFHLPYPPSPKASAAAFYFTKILSNLQKAITDKSKGYGCKYIIGLAK